MSAVVCVWVLGAVFCVWCQNPFTLRIFLLHQVRSDVRSSGVRVRSEFGLDITRGRKDDVASAYVLRPL
jgi:hypothetical protein